MEAEQQTQVPFGVDEGGGEAAEVRGGDRLLVRLQTIKHPKVKH